MAVYLVPSPLDEDGLNAIPQYVTDAIKQCQVFFVENERTTRRYFKQLWRDKLPGEHIVIDDHEWYTIGADTVEIFQKKIKENKHIGIVSEAGCPGVADPGQGLIAIAQQMNAEIKPLAGPSSILLALMASGMNGQQFQFLGYLPIDNVERVKTIKQLETESQKKNCTQIFIETPYRNNQVLEALLKTCSAQTLICIAMHITGKDEMIKTLTAGEWQKNKPELHKRPVIFLLYAGQLAT